jgi:uncharacterized protein YuzE
MMRITYDLEAGAAYFYLKEGIREVTTVRITEDLAIDLGPGEEPVGIEVLAASKHLGLSPDVKQVGIETVSR